MLESFDRTYTPASWDCLGFRFKETDMLYKINNIAKAHRPLVKSLPDDKFKYHLIFNNTSLPALVMKVSPKDGQTVIIDEIYPLCFSGRIPIYNAVLNKIIDDNLNFVVYDKSGDNILLQSQVLLPPDQRDLLYFIDNDTKIEIKENNKYNLILYLLTPVVDVYHDLSNFKKAMQNISDIYSDITENINSSEKDSFNIAGKINSVKILLNHYTGRRFLEIEFIYKNSRFIAYTSTKSVEKLPKQNEYIVCKQCTAQGEIILDNNITSTPEKSSLKKTSPILEFDIEYLYSYDSTVKFKKDEIFDGDIKIEYINVRLYNNAIKLQAAVFKNMHDRQEIFLTKDGNFEKEIEELKELNFQENREQSENLIEGRYWFIRYGDMYIEGFENTPTIIDAVKRIINFDEIIEVIKLKYIQKQEKDNK